MRKYFSWVIAVLAVAVLIGGFVWYQNTPLIFTLSLVAKLTKNN